MSTNNNNDIIATSLLLHKYTCVYTNTDNAPCYEI